MIVPENDLSEGTVRFSSLKVSALFETIGLSPGDGAEAGARRDEEDPVAHLKNARIYASQVKSEFRKFSSQGELGSGHRQGKVHPRSRQSSGRAAETNGAFSPRAQVRSDLRSSSGQRRSCQAVRAQVQVRSEQVRAQVDRPDQVRAQVAPQKRME